MLSWLTRRNPYKAAAEALYVAIVAQSRLPVFYAACDVPDTVTGRFEMIVLHMFLTLDRLQATGPEEGDAGEQLGQSLNEAFMADLDDAMREMGVADVRVSKRMHQAAGAFFGRLMAYREAAGKPPTGAADALAEAIARNVLAETGDDSVAPASATPGHSAAALAAYCRDVARHLRDVPLATLRTGQISFPAPSLPSAAASRENTLQ